MSGPLRALAIDYDGTLATEGGPAVDVLRALDDARQRGLRIVLVTGRMLDELGQVFPEVDAHVDLIVAENGSILAQGSNRRPLTHPVDRALDAALAEAGATFRRGEILLATTVEFEQVVAESVHRLGLDYQLVHNRGELMVLPAGVTKGTGLRQALADLGVSRHDTIAVGDAENDLSLLAGAEIAVAVANAIDSVKAHADLVLDKPDGEGIRDLLAESFLTRARKLQPARHQVVIGRDPSGRAVTMPGSGLNLLISGPAGSGKSYVAGLLAEQLTRADFSLLIVDPEGDYHELRSVPNVVIIGSDGPLPTAGELVELFHHRSMSVVVDLSGHDRDERRRFFSTVPPVIQTNRLVTGVPHWIVVDEAHEAFGRDGAVLPFFRSEVKGFVLVSYQPERLADEVLESVDIEVLLPSILRDSSPEAAARPTSPSQVVVVDRGNGATLVTLVARQTGHVRHWHKYVAGQIPTEHRFYWRAAPDRSLGVSSANLTEFHRQLSRADPAAIVHHSAGHDFSRWLRGVLTDVILADTVLAIEHRLNSMADLAAVEQARAALLGAIEDRYLD